MRNGTKNIRNRFTTAQRVLAVRKYDRMKRKGIKHRDICKQLGVSGQTILNWRALAGAKRIQHTAPSNGAVQAAGSLLGGLTKRVDAIWSEWNAFKKALGVTDADLGR